MSLLMQTTLAVLERRKAFGIEELHCGKGRLVVVVVVEEEEEEEVVVE